MKRVVILATAVMVMNGCASCPSHPWLSRLFRRDCPPVLEAPPTTSLTVPAPVVTEAPPLPPPRVSEMMPSPRLAPEYPAPPNSHQP
jgi:hypothetical protein